MFWDHTTTTTTSRKDRTPLQFLSRHNPDHLELFLRPKNLNQRPPKRPKLQNKKRLSMRRTSFSKRTLLVTFQHNKCGPDDLRSTAPSRPIGPVEELSGSKRIRRQCPSIHTSERLWTRWPFNPLRVTVRSPFEDIIPHPLFDFQKRFQTNAFVGRPHLHDAPRHLIRGMRTNAHSRICVSAETFVVSVRVDPEQPKIQILFVVIANILESSLTAEAP